MQIREDRQKTGYHPMSRSSRNRPAARAIVPEQQTSKRNLLKKAAYVAPAILTLEALPSFASNGLRDSRFQTWGWMEFCI